MFLRPRCSTAKCSADNETSCGTAAFGISINGPTGTRAGVLYRLRFQHRSVGQDLTARRFDGERLLRWAPYCRFAVEQPRNSNGVNLKTLRRWVVRSFRGLCWHALTGSTRVEDDAVCLALIEFAHGTFPTWASAWRCPFIGANRIER